MRQSWYPCGIGTPLGTDGTMLEAGWEQPATIARAPTPRVRFSCFIISSSSIDVTWRLTMPRADSTALRVTATARNGRHGSTPARCRSERFHACAYIAHRVCLVLTYQFLYLQA